MVRRTIKGWLKEVSSIVVITLLKKELNGRDDMLNTQTRNLIRRNIEDKGKKDE